MGKLLFAVVVAIASFALVDSLVCQKCSVSLFGFCLNSNNETCTGNNTVCYTGKSNFPITGFGGFSNQGCRVNDTSCNKTTTSTLLLGIDYNTTIACCETDRCNPVTLTSAAPAKMSAAITGAVLASVLASVLGSML